MQTSTKPAKIKRQKPLRSEWSLPKYESKKNHRKNSLKRLNTEYENKASAKVANIHPSDYQYGYDHIF